MFICVKLWFPDRGVREHPWNDKPPGSRARTTLVPFQKVIRTVTAGNSWEVMTWGLAVTCALALVQHCWMEPLAAASPWAPAQGASAFLLQHLRTRVLSADTTAGPTTKQFSSWEGWAVFKEYWKPVEQTLPAEAIFIKLFLSYMQQNSPPLMHIYHKTKHLNWTWKKSLHH